jgi:hypothetical protein
VEESLKDDIKNFNLDNLDNIIDDSKMFETYKELMEFESEEIKELKNVVKSMLLFFLVGV